MQPVSREQVKEIVARALQQLMSDDATLRTAVASLSSPQTRSSPAVYLAPWTGEVYTAHPSQQQFSIGESAQSSSGADELLDFIETRLCTIEKHKPCDHCGLCRSLGF